MLFYIKDAQAWAMLLVRIILGTTFLAHGLQKVFGFFGGPGLAGFATSCKQMGIPPLLAQAAALFELMGGIMILLGIAAEVGALMIVCVMIGAIITAHSGHGYFAQQGGYEYPLNLLLLAVALIIGGPGAGIVLWDPIKNTGAKNISSDTRGRS